MLTVFIGGRTTIADELRSLKNCRAVVKVRDLSKKADAKEESKGVVIVEWYEQAFGKLKDMMEVTFILIHAPLTQSILRTKVALATFEYFMNEELKEAYTPQYKDHFTDVVTLNKIDDKEYVGKILLPFGRIASVEFKENEKIMRDDPEQGVQIAVSIYPKVKSEAERRKDKEHYENEQHNREQHMKSEHIRALEEKRRQEEEKERFKAAMGKIMDKLCAVWKNIDHSFINTEEDEGDCLSLFSIHYEELFPVYQAYARQVPQFCKNPENYYILLQHFFHFLKEYGFGCKTMEEYYTLLASLSPLIDSKPSDTLNLHYGMNFAGFVELILRIAFLKTQQDLGGPMGMEEFKEGEELPKGVSKLLPPTGRGCHQAGGAACRVRCQSGRKPREVQEKRHALRRHLQNLQRLLQHAWGDI
eukprot:TRINITY_DN12545_c0_g4_i1.p1 TRINITY_DN12545_c0_g4~~TRINITY_DN12545_c0_g4_i1.p1  ORF type:complete len:417 (+),score=130.02 TRINITY_DN12545_c0_g4_i1:308-1558(+)